MEKTKLFEGALTLLITLLEEEKLMLQGVNDTPSEKINNNLKNPDEIGKSNIDGQNKPAKSEQAKQTPNHPIVKDEVKKVKHLYEPVATDRIAIENYPSNNKTFDKVIFLSLQNPGFWCLKEMQILIEKIEGTSSEITLKSFRQKLHVWTNQKKIVSVQFSTRKLAFYGLKEWIDKGELFNTYRIKPGLEPKNQFLNGVNIEELEDSQITWNGIE
ncbi:MAG: hypothetical protein M3Q58_01885 [Bacteroidota bacterium]|nr:hypothetical protein [Bacteroidota bacterium]